MRSPHIQPFLNAMPDLVAGDIDLHRFAMISTPSTLDTGAQVFLQRGLTLAAEWTVQGLVPHISDEASTAPSRPSMRGWSRSSRVPVRLERSHPELGHQEARLPWI